MRIAIVSDTHRSDKYINVARNYIKNAEILIHLGDNTDDVEKLTKGFEGEVYSVSGNCDYGSKMPSEQIIELGDKRIFITHGHNYGVKYSLNNIYYRGKELNADIVLFGHTHEALVLEEDGIIFMNPGSISLPRGTSRSIGYIEINDEIDAYLKKVED